MNPPPPGLGRPKSSPLLIAGAVILAVLNLVLLFAGLEGGQGRAYMLGALLGAALVQGLIVYGVTAVVKGPARATVAFWTLAVVFLINLARIGARGAELVKEKAQTEVSAAERRGLQAEADSIRHRGLGFILPHPGPGFVANPEIQARVDQAFAAYPDAAAWVYSDTSRAESLMIQVTKFARLNERVFREFVTGIRNGATKGNDATVLLDSVAWQGGRGDGRLSLQHSAGFYMKTRCVTRETAVVCAQTTSPEPDRLDAVRDGLVVIP